MKNLGNRIPLLGPRTHTQLTKTGRPSLPGKVGFGDSHRSRRYLGIAIRRG